MNIHNKTSNRAVIRQQIRKERKLLTAAQQLVATEQLTTLLMMNKRVHSAKHIAIYLNVDSEISTQLFIDWCWHQNKCVYLPVIHPFSPGNLLFIEFNKNTPMNKNTYGIWEPKLDVRKIKHSSCIDIMFTPLVAFDNKGARMGMGGGFYDRTLANWYSHKKVNNPILPYPIGLAHDCQQVENIPLDAWDVPLPELVTPSQHFIFSN